MTALDTVLSVTLAAFAVLAVGELLASTAVTLVGLVALAAALLAGMTLATGALVTGTRTWLAAPNHITEAPTLR